MENNIVLSKEEYAELIKTQIKYDMIEEITRDKNIKYSSDFVEQVKRVIGIKTEEQNND